MVPTNNYTCIRIFKHHFKNIKLVRIRYKNTYIYIRNLYIHFKNIIRWVLIHAYLNIINVISEILNSDKSVKRTKPHVNSSCKSMRNNIRAAKTAGISRSCNRSLP